MFANTNAKSHVKVFHYQNTVLPSRDLPRGAEVFCYDWYMVTNARKLLSVWLTLRSTSRQMDCAFAKQPWKCCKRMSCLQTEIQSYANSTPSLTAVCTEETKGKTIYYQQYALYRFQGDIKQTYRFPCVQASKKRRLHKQQQRHQDLFENSLLTFFFRGKLNHSGCTRANSSSFSPNLSVEKAFDECRLYYCY